MLARTVSRRALTSRVAAPSRKFLTTSAAPKKRTWKGAAVRWGLAGAGLYYYNTTDIFAEQEEAAINRLEKSIHHIQESELPTIEAIVAEKRARAAARAAEDKAKAKAAAAAEAAAAPASDSSDASQESEGSAAAAPATEGEDGGDLQGGPLGDLEAEAGQEGAFNPETGEINWDCPCLGGMAHGPCGEEFREAFSCFVHSTEEPKGMECIEKFKGMQDCFRAHPDMYGAELEDEEEEIEAEIRAQEAAKAEARENDAAAAESQDDKVTPMKEAQDIKAAVKEKAVEKAPAPTHPETADAGEKVVPKTAYDATDADVKTASVLSADFQHGSSVGAGREPVLVPREGEILDESGEITANVLRQIKVLQEAVDLLRGKENISYIYYEKHAMVVKKKVFTTPEPLNSKETFQTSSSNSC
ncbi:hypothetical protein V498_03209 [Pseudogymnoascus sp. VKM F-4517 (FW-2822)]|nr:hypothetical protein V498_03209 [Pseudogymnoascus sp. VKM F-4517 (FW-2822)]